MVGELFDISPCVSDNKFLTRVVWPGNWRLIASIAICFYLCPELQGDLAPGKFRPYRLLIICKGRSIHFLKGSILLQSPVIHRKRECSPRKHQEKHPKWQCPWNFRHSSLELKTSRIRGWSWRVSPWSWSTSQRWTSKIICTLMFILLLSSEGVI